jgi:5-(carboxyamino)imidazole ribonucleotide synthase
MLNLLGDLWDADGAPPPWQEALALPGVHLHLYGKAAARRGRKMGHLTVTAAVADEALRIAREAARRLRLPLG